MRTVGTGKTGFVRGFLICGSAATALCLPGIALAQDGAATQPAAAGERFHSTSMT